MMEKKYRYFIHLSYNGKNYNGWQIQENAPSVQAIVNDACSAIFQNEINVVGCGRTDTGVHALNFYAHFELPKELNIKSKTIYLNKLNGFLPADIKIIDLLQVQARCTCTFQCYFKDL